MEVLENWEVHSGRITKLYTLPLKVEGGFGRSLGVAVTMVFTRILRKWLEFRRRRC
ncbi:unnamed protein product [Brassica rapa subsp. narinosa]